MPGIIILTIVLGSGFALFMVFLLRSILAPKRVETLAHQVKQGKTQAATRLAKRMLAKEPRNAQVRYFLGLAYQQEGKYELALMELRMVNQIGRFEGLLEEAPFRRKTAELFLRFRQTEEALKEYLLLIKLEPEEADHYYRVGKLFEERNRTDKAYLYFRKAVELNPRHSDVHFGLGLLLYRSKKPIESRKELEQALRFQPDNHKAHFYLGKLQKDAHDYVSALGSFEKAQRDPEFKVKALVERGGCYMSTNSFDRAMVELERAVKLVQDESAPEALYARYFLAMCFERSRDIDRAVQQWEKIYSKKPAFRDVAEKLSQYQEIRMDDQIKDYLTSTKESFFDMCNAVATGQGFTIRDVSEIPNGCQIIAVQNDSAKWRNTRKLPHVFRFFRVTEVIDEGTVRSFHDELRNLSVQRGVMVTSSSFTRAALDFAESRPIELYGKEQLQEMLKAVDLSGSRSAR
jgi:tetratricopeptide (TPR) repeat protein